MIALCGCKGDQLEDAFHFFERPGPGIALVAHEGLQDREHGVVFLAVDMFDNAEQRRGIGKMRYFVQEAQGLDLGVGAGFQPVMYFQHQLIGKDERGIVLSCPDTVDVGRIDRRLCGKPSRGREKDFAAVAGVQYFAAPERRQYRACEAFARIRFIQQTGQGTAAQPRGGMDE